MQKWRSKCKKQINYVCVFPLKVIPTQAYILKKQFRLCVGNVSTVCFVFSWVSMLKLDFGTASAGRVICFFSSFILIILSHRLYLSLFIFQVINQEVLLFSVIRLRYVYIMHMMCSTSILNNK